MELPGALFRPKFEKQKNPARKKFFIFREMELSGSNIKKFLNFSYILGNGNPEKNFLYFRKRKPEKASYISEMELLSPILKNKKTHPGKRSLYFRKWNFLTLRLNNFLYFLKRKPFLYFLKWDAAFFSTCSKIHTEKVELSNSNIFSKESFSYISGNKNPQKFFVFHKAELSYISGNRNPKKLIIFKERTSRLEKNEKDLFLKCFLYFRKWNFLESSLKNFLYSRRNFQSPIKPKFLIFFLKIQK